MDQEFLIAGTELSYTDWTQGYLHKRLTTMWQRRGYREKWTLELAFMNQSDAGFTAGYRLIAAELPDMILFEVTWTRKDSEVILISYVAHEEEIDHLDACGQTTAPKPRVGRNTKHHRF